MNAYRYAARAGGALLIAIAVLAGAFRPAPALANPGNTPPGNQIFLPAAYKNYNIQPLLTGFFSDTVEEMNELDTWLTGVKNGRHSSIVHMFSYLNAPIAPEKLERFWEAGYTSFINLTYSKYPMSEWASSKHDWVVRAWARSYAQWVNQGGSRVAFIALFQEMNIETRDPSRQYVNDPENFKLAFRRFQQIFLEEGVDRSEVRWVFAPNGWSTESNRFELYYPGDDVIDVVGFSSYNYGYCVTGHGAAWLTPEQVFNPPQGAPGQVFRYLDRMRAMAPTKPIFIIETGSSNRFDVEGGANEQMRDQWMMDAYDYLARQPGVKAVLYFNTHDYRPEVGVDCDYTIFDYGATKYWSPGYKAAVTKPVWGYTPPQWMRLQFP